MPASCLAQVREHAAELTINRHEREAEVVKGLSDAADRLLDWGLPAPSEDSTSPPPQVTGQPASAQSVEVAKGGRSK